MNEIRDAVKEHYGEAARQVKSGRSACCATSKVESTCCATSEAKDPISSDLYAEEQTGALPAEAVLASLGCGNPTMLAGIREGETVLDLGSGGGIDVLLSARRVGPSGKVYGLDMTKDMLALARENQRKAGIENVEFLEGEIENIPLPDASVDLIISNCVINLSTDKRRVLREAFRVLRPGGRFAISDIVRRKEIDPQLGRNLDLWCGCIAGALQESEYGALLSESGFQSIEIVPTRVYHAEDAREFLADAGIDPDSVTEEVEGAFASAFVRATKPA